MPEMRPCVECGALHDNPGITCSEDCRKKRRKAQQQAYLIRKQERQLPAAETLAARWHAGAMNKAMCLRQVQKLGFARRATERAMYEIMRGVPA